MSEPIMKRVTGDGVQIQLAEWEGEGKDVLCIHGITANCRCWDVIAAAASPEHRIIAMDLRGRGHSESPSSGYSIERHCRDIVAVLDEVGIKRAVIMGHSLGAFISVVFGATYPDRVDSIILVDGGGKLSESQLVKVFAGIKPSLDRLGQTFPSFDAYLDLMKKAPFLKEWSSALDTYYRYETEAVDGGVRSRVHPDHIEEERINLGKVDVSKFYGKINCPVLILRATEGMLALDDLLLPQDVSERMVREFPNATCVDVDGTNHYSIVFQPNDTRDRAIREFLGGIE